MENHTPEKSIPKKSLPENGDETFWLDGEQYSEPIRKFLLNKEHYWEQRGHQAICRSCPLIHGIYLGVDKEIRDGKIVARRILK